MKADFKYQIELTQEEYKTIYTTLILEKVRAKTEDNTVRLNLIEAAIAALTKAL